MATPTTKQKALHAMDAIMMATGSASTVAIQLPLLGLNFNLHGSNGSDPLRRVLVENEASLTTRGFYARLLRVASTLRRVSSYSFPTKRSTDLARGFAVEPTAGYLELDLDTAMCTKQSEKPASPTRHHCKWAGTGGH